VVFGFYPRWLERYMSYCVDCGRELPASAAFCGRCGSPVQPPVTGGSFRPTGWVTESLPAPSPASATPPAAAHVLEPRPTPQPQPSAPSSSATKRFIQKPAVLIVATVIILCVAGGLLYGVAGGLLHVALTGSSSSSAQSVASTVVTDLQQGNFSQLCVLAPPAQQAKCQSDVSQMSVQHATFTNLALGTVTVNGDQALFTMTGTACVGSTGQCTSNSDPNVAMSAGQTFQQAYAETVSATSSTVFIWSLVKQSGKWYVTIS
jgi:zinc-ribbon domain